MTRSLSSGPAQAVGEIVQDGELSLDATDKKLEAPDPQYVWVKYAADDPRNGALATTRPETARPTSGSTAGGSSGTNKRKWRKGH